MNFRTLKADEIECRVATVSAKGCSLLLYKDARADMNLLDETVGSENWQRNHELINGNLFCNVGIKIDGEWVWKQDVGTESYTEKEKGQASDSFKRACVCWGIGRELYTAPFVWVDAKLAGIDTTNGKTTTKKRFRVSHIAYDTNRNISELTIVGDKDGEVCYNLSSKPIAKKQEVKKEVEPEVNKESEPEVVAPDERMQEAELKAKVIGYLNRHQLTQDKIKKLCQLYNVESLSDLKMEHCKHYIACLENKGGNIDE